MTVSPLSIRLLGAFEVQVAGQPLRPLRPRSVEWLLALLVLRHGQDLSRAWLAGTLWPGSSEANGLYNLRRNLMALRQALGVEAVRLRTPDRATLGFEVTGADADVIRFDAAIAAGDERSLEEAVALYRGPLLEGCSEEWVFPERESRAEACLQALETLADRATERGDPAGALAYLGQAAALDPLRDSTQRRRMQLLAAGGDLPAALFTYREHRLRLHRELNAEPDPETTQLFQELRTGGGRTALRRPPPPTGTTSRAPPDCGLGTKTGSPDGVSPSLLDHPQSAIRGALWAPPSPAPLPRPLTALIGRNQEVQEVVRSVRAARLVTLIGGGGVGKTRLAIQAAEELVADFPEGVAFVELASLADPALLPGHVAAALGLREEDIATGTGPPGLEALVQALGGWLTLHPVLLVLDNCEHLVEGTAALTQALLAACPALRILATSRQRLGLTGEVVWRVPSLPAPDPERLPADGPGAVEAVLSFPAVQLFMERAAAARSEFRLAGREDAAAVARICQRLDGIPLALELAAARVSLLTSVQIAARLDDRFRLLTGGSRGALPRQQTLQALIDWSYHLLPAAERTLLCRLSVFAGGWSLEAAEAVCSGVRVSGTRAAGGYSGVQEGGGSGPEYSNTRTPEHLNTEDVLDLLSALEEKSLVLVELREGAIRYRVLETVREYAREKLAASGELVALRQRHRDWYLQLAEQADARARGPEHKADLARLAAEIDNLRAALAWCQEAAEAHPGSAAAEVSLRLADALYWLWIHYGYLTEGSQWLERALVCASDAPTPLRARALFRAPRLAQRGERERHLAFLQPARQGYQTVLSLARTKGDRSGIAAAELALAEVTLVLADWDAAWRHGLEARQRMAERGDRMGLVRSLEVLGNVALAREDRRAARPLLEERLAHCREFGASDFLLHALGAVGHLERDEGNYAHAHLLYEESLVLRREWGDRFALAQGLEDFAVLAGRERHAERAVRLLGASEAFCETIGARCPTVDVAEYERTVSEGRAALGEAAFAAAWAEGRAMPLEQAVEYALGEG